MQEERIAPAGIAGTEHPSSRAGSIAAAEAERGLAAEPCCVWGIRGGMPLGSSAPSAMLLWQETQGRTRMSIPQGHLEGQHRSGSGMKSITEKHLGESSGCDARGG